MKAAKIKTIGIFLLFLPILITIINGIIQNQKLEKNHRYTIGIIDRIKINARLGESVYFHFQVNKDTIHCKDIIYISYYGYSKDNIIGRHFIVKYQPDNPKNCEILLNYKVAKNIKAPSYGWKKIPDLVFLPPNVDNFYK